MNAKSPAPGFLLALTVVLATHSSVANDWPQWRGPMRDGTSKETGLLPEWPADGPKLLWKRTDIGSGYSTPAIVGEQIYLLSNEGLENEFVQALAVRDGSRVWQTRLGKVGNPDQNPKYPGARSTPTVDGKFLYALGSDGDLACVAVDSGAVRWQKSLRRDFGGKPGIWAYSESPLVEGDVLVCTPGGTNATIVALNKNTGNLIWKCVVLGTEASAYSSPMAAKVAGVEQFVQMLDKGLVGVAAKTGELLWRYDHTMSIYRANIPSPLVVDGYVYSAGAGKGGGKIQLKQFDGKFTPEEIYFSPKLPTAIGGVVKVGDCLYGTTRQTMLCVDFKSGAVKWEERAIGAASLCFVDGRLYLHGENGEVALVEPTSVDYREKGRFNPPDRPKRLNQMEQAWAYPVVANGKFYLRDQSVLWCYDVKKR